MGKVFQTIWAAILMLNVTVIYSGQGFSYVPELVDEEPKYAEYLFEKTKIAGEDSCCKLIENLVSELEPTLNKSDSLAMEIKKDKLGQLFPMVTTERYTHEIATKVLLWYYAQNINSDTGIQFLSQIYDSLDCTFIWPLLHTSAVKCSSKADGLKSVLKILDQRKWWSFVDVEFLQQFLPDAREQLVDYIRNYPLNENPLMGDIHGYDSSDLFAVPYSEFGPVFYYPLYNIYSRIKCSQLLMDEHIFSKKFLEQQLTVSDNLFTKMTTSAALCARNNPKGINALSDILEQTRIINRGIIYDICHSLKGEILKNEKATELSRSLRTKLDTFYFPKAILLAMVDAVDVELAGFKE